ncbi:MAG: TatD DNase family protein [Alteromonadaceae bacterium]
MIDIGINLTNTRFDKDRDEVILNAKLNGVNGLLVTGTNILESQKAVNLCEKHSGYLCSTAGVHPHDADNVQSDYLDCIEKLTESIYVKAIGECGLDFNRNFSTADNQINVFSNQIELAAKLNLPLFLHQRDAFDLWYKMLSPYFDKVPAMIAHCFTGSINELQQCLDAGMYIGITGWLCDERRGQELRADVHMIPLERLLIETDAPYLTPRTIRPKPKSSRNEPSYLSYIVDTIADLTDYSAKQIREQTEYNSRRIFNWTC